MATPALTLEVVDAAILAVNKGQKYTLPGGVMVERPNLAELMELRRTLQGEASNARAGGGIMRPIALGRAT